jgi:hypothetical protein
MNDRGSDTDEAPHDTLAAEAFAIPGPGAGAPVPHDPTGIPDPHDTLAADAFAIPGPDPHSPAAFPHDPTGIPDPHDTLAADAFAIPAAAEVPSRRRGPTRPGLLPVLGALGVLAWLRRRAAR